MEPVVYGQAIQDIILESSRTAYTFGFALTKGEGKINFWLGKISTVFNPLENSLCVPFEDKPFITLGRDLTPLHGVEIDLPVVWRYNSDPDYNETLKLCFFLDNKKMLTFEIYDTEDNMVQAGELLAFFEYLIIYTGKSSELPSSYVATKKLRAY